MKTIAAQILSFSDLFYSIYENRRLIPDCHSRFNYAFVSSKTLKDSLHI